MLKGASRKLAKTFPSRNTEGEVPGPDMPYASSFSCKSVLRKSYKSISWAPLGLETSKTDVYRVIVWDYRNN